MKYYFGPPELSTKTNDYTLLANTMMVDEGHAPRLEKEYNFFILESCRFYIDGMDPEELTDYYELVRSAHSNLLIHKNKIEVYFKNYVNSLFNHKALERNKESSNISELVISLMLSELDMANILKHVNLGTQEVDVQSIKDSVKLEKINRIKKMHDRVLFFIENYNKHVKM